MTATPRERARERTMADITRIGRAHLTEHGADGLSLRAVARDLGVVSSAVYRYVRSRDELVTLLVVDAYTELGDEVDAAVRAAGADDYAAQFRAAGWAVRDWAIRERARYALLFGTPVPGYHAPAEQTTVPGTRVIVTLIGIYDRAYRAGAVHIRQETALPARLAADLERIRIEYGIACSDQLIALGMLAWAALFGAVSFDVFDQYGPDTVTDRAELFEHHLGVLTATVGLSR